MKRCGKVRGVAPAQRGLAWYTRGWERLRELAADRDALDNTFEAWEDSARVAIGDLTAEGRAIRTIPIDVDALAAWCRQHGRPLDSAARAAYVTHLMRTNPASVKR